MAVKKTRGASGHVRMRTNKTKKLAVMHPHIYNTPKIVQHATTTGRDPNQNTVKQNHQISRHTCVT